MTVLDWILLAIGVLSAFWGVLRGLVREVLSVAGWIASFWLAQIHAPQVGQWLPWTASNETVQHLAGFVVVFVAVLVTIVVDLSPWREAAVWQESMVAQWLQASLHTLRPLLPAEFGKYLN